LEYEVNAIRQLHTWNLPAPEIHTPGELSELRGQQNPTDDWVLLGDGGESLTRFLDEQPELMNEAGKLVKQYHSRTFDGYGKIVDGKVVPDDMHAERLVPLGKRMLRHSQQGLIAQELAEAAYETLKDYRPVGTPVLCHGELTLPHLLVEDGQLTVPIDWSYMASLPATYDLASLEVYCEVSGYQFDGFLAGYGLDKAAYLADPDRTNCRLIHIVRQLATLSSKTFSKLKKALQQSFPELGRTS
jgi:hypothetical protein